MPAKLVSTRMGLRHISFGFSALRSGRSTPSTRMPPARHTRRRGCGGLRWWGWVASGGMDALVTTPCRLEAIGGAHEPTVPDGQLMISAMALATGSWIDSRSVPEPAGAPQGRLATGYSTPTYVHELCTRITAANSRSAFCAYFLINAQSNVHSRL